jgi:hypothetical protein
MTVRLACPRIPTGGVVVVARAIRTDSVIVEPG